MTRKQRRTTIIVSGVTVAVAVTLLVLSALKDSIVYFHSPTDVVEKGITPDQTIRIGGLVAEGSVLREGETGKGQTVNFSVTDMAETISVEYTGILPDLFREGQGVVVEGAFDQGGKFVAKTVLAKHDENYMPPEVADALKEVGHWETFEGGEMDTSNAPAPSNETPKPAEENVSDGEQSP